MIRHTLAALTLCVFMVQGASAQASDDALPLYYAIKSGVIIYSSPDSTRPYVSLQFREPVYLLDERGRWLHVKTQDGAQGYLPASTVSNVWIRVSKLNKTLYVYRGTELLMKVAADFGINGFADKERRGSTSDPDHWRTPDGIFFVSGKNAQSQFYKALVLNYPTAEDAERGRTAGLISQTEYDAILRAETEFRTPPMNTALGGWIEIHGKGTGVGTNWTQGCVAVRDAHMDELWKWAHVGTPVIIE